MKYLFSVVAVILLSVPVRAQDGFESFFVSDSGQLKGIGAVHVVVEELNPEAEGLGLRKADIQQDTELGLSTAGIRIETREQRLARNSGVLYVKVGSHCDDTCGFSIEVLYRETVLARRDPANILITFATTWKAAGTNGTVGESNLHQVRDSVKNQVDQFINAYLAANPK